MSTDITTRIQQHNAGKSRFTKGHRPWELVYSEQYESYEEGRKREKYLKSAAGKRWLESQKII